MRVLMLGWEFPPDVVGGLGTACAGLVGALDRRGHEVVFVMPTPPRLAAEAPGGGEAVVGPVEGTRRARRVVLPLVVGPAYVPEQARGLAARDPREAAARYARLTLAALASVGGADVVHAHDWLTFAAAEQSARWLRRGWVAHVHSLEVDRAGAGGDGRIAALERAGLSAAPAVVTVSRRERALCLRHGAGGDRCRVVYNGVEGEFRAPARGPREGVRTVLFLGRLTAQKGPGHFLRAAAALRARRGDVRFVMGGAGDQAAAVRALAADLGLAAHVSFPGFLRGEAWTAAFRGADCLVMTSEAEPFGITALEALREGVPAIVPPEAGVAEVVGSLPTCDPRRPEALAATIDALLDDGAARARLVRAGAEEARALTWDRAAAGCESAYDAARGARGHADDPGRA